MKRFTLFTLVLGIAALIVAPALQARVMSDDSAGGNAKVLPADINGGSTGTSVTLHTDILGGDGIASAVPIRPDVLGGNGGPTTSPAPISNPGDSFPWDVTLATATVFGAMLLTLASVAVTRRRHRLSF